MRRVCVLGPGQPERGFRAGGEGSARRGVALIGNVLRGGGGFDPTGKYAENARRFFHSRRGVERSECPGVGLELEVLMSVLIDRYKADINV